MDHLDILTRREQLMEDIDSIVEEHAEAEQAALLTRLLCDAVCKNFPS